MRELSNAAVAIMKSAIPDKDHASGYICQKGGGQYANIGIKD